jgi:hypothetical protein
MKAATKIAQAVGAWPQYEFACDRSNVFNEGYMSVPIASALSAIYRGEIRSEYRHPVLAPAMVGRGRRPEVDFAVVSNFPDVSCVLESKWVGKHATKAEDILWDLLRLELIAHHSKAPAFFLLAGRRKHIDSFFRSRKFTGEPTSQGKYRPLLKIEGGLGGGNIRVDSPNSDRKNIFSSLLRDFSETSFPSQITTSSAQFYPIECPMYQYRVYVWAVLAPTGMPRFQPKNNRHYQFKEARK